jgi:t-SNARE complex subunit (syntaxin)
MESTTEIRKLEIEEDSIKYLDATRKWTMFLAILGFIGIGIMLIIGIVAGLFLSVFKTESSLSTLEVIYFFPMLFLFRFSKHTSNAVKTLDKQELRKAFKNLRAYFVYLGILILVVLVAYVVIFAVAGASVAFLKDLG